MGKSEGRSSAGSSLLGRPVGANSEETRKRILDATMRCVADVGYSRATIREIARAAQMTSGSLYHYFSEQGRTGQGHLRRGRDDRGATARAGRGAQRLDHRQADGRPRRERAGDAGLPARGGLRPGHPRREPRDLQLAENSDVRFMALHSLIRDILEQGARENALAPGVDVDSAAGAIFLIFRGLNEYAAGTPPAAEYHATVAALKQLLRGRLSVRPSRRSRRRSNSPASPGRAGPSAGRRDPGDLARRRRTRRSMPSSPSC